MDEPRSQVATEPDTPSEPPVPTAGVHAGDQLPPSPRLIAFAPNTPHIQPPELAADELSAIDTASTLEANACSSQETSFSSGQPQDPWPVHPAPNSTLVHPVPDPMLARTASENSARQNEYSPISGWLLVAIGLMIGGLFLQAFSRKLYHHPPERTGAVRLAVDVNRASVEELQILPRIGPALARRIAEYVGAHGPVYNLQQLQEVRGLGPRMVEELAPYLVFPSELTEPNAIAVLESSEPLAGSSN